jgi:hypothetical protein
MIVTINNDISAVLFFTLESIWGMIGWMKRITMCLEKLNKWQDSVVRSYDNWLKKMKVCRLEEAALLLRTWAKNIFIQIVCNDVKL